MPRGRARRSKRNEAAPQGSTSVIPKTKATLALIAPLALSLLVHFGAEDGIGLMQPIIFGLVGGLFVCCVLWLLDRHTHAFSRIEGTNRDRWYFDKLDRVLLRQEQDRDSSIIRIDLYLSGGKYETLTAPMLIEIEELRSYFLENGVQAEIVPNQPLEPIR